MPDEDGFLRSAEAALAGLKRHLIEREQHAKAAFEIEEQGGSVNIVFEDPGVRFVISPNAPVRQMWVVALSKSSKLNWDSGMEEFILPNTGETLIAVVDRLIGEYHGG
jgi:CyaY protein